MVLRDKRSDDDMRYLPFLLLFLTSCTSKPHAINHVVFIELNDPSQATALIEDSNARLATIPTVKDYFCGTHVPAGRDTVKTDYDVGNTSFFFFFQSCCCFSYIFFIYFYFFYRQVILISLY